MAPTPKRDGGGGGVKQNGEVVGKQLPELALEGLAHHTGCKEEEEASLVSGGPSNKVEAAGRTLGSGALRPALLALVTLAACAAAGLFLLSWRLGVRAAESATELCNASRALPGAPPVGGGAAFQMPGAWGRKCWLAPATAPPEWAGLNWCWEAVKMECYLSGGDYITWQEAQRRAAAQGKTPPREENASFQGLLRPDLCDGRPTPEPAGAGDVGAAARWLERTVDVRVLNLDADTARLASMSGNLGRLGIPFRRIGGVRLTAANVAEAKSRGLLPQNFSFEAAHNQSHSRRDRMEGNLYGTAGCLAAHMLAMRIATEEADPRPLVLVLEDDIQLSDGFAGRLRRLLEEEAPCDWAAISLMSRCPYGQCMSEHLTRVAPDVNALAEKCRQGVNWGTQAMLYRRDRLADVRARVWAVAWNESRPHCLDVDVALASISDQFAYYAVPSIQASRFVFFARFNSSRINGR